MQEDVFPEITKAKNFIDLAYETLEDLYKTSNNPNKDEILIDGKNKIHTAWGLHQSADTSSQLTNSYANMIIAAGECASKLIGKT